MSTHVAHPDTAKHGLADLCERCMEQAANPWYELDQTNLRNLLWRTIARKESRSHSEAVAMKNIADALDRAGAMYAAAPEVVMSRLMDWSPSECNDERRTS